MFNEMSEVLLRHIAERRGILQKHMEGVPGPLGTVQSSCQLGEYVRMLDQGHSFMVLQEVEEWLERVWMVVHQHEILERRSRSVSDPHNATLAVAERLQRLTGPLKRRLP